MIYQPQPPHTWKVNTSTSTFQALLCGNFQVSAQLMEVTSTTMDSAGEVKDRRRKTSVVETQKNFPKWGNFLGS